MNPDPQATLAAREVLASNFANAVQGAVRNERTGSENGAVALEELNAPSGAFSAAAELQAIDGLSPQLQGLNGEIEGIDLGGLDLEAQAPDGKTPRHSYASGLSGSEFLSALNSIRGADSRGQGSSLGGGFAGNGNGNLKLIAGGLAAAKGTRKPSGFGSTAEELAGIGQPGQASPQTSALAAEVTGHVVKGAMSQDRLSSEALAGVSAGIRNLAPKGGGEIRIRLKPENLGELHLRVVTRGDQVGLQIHASDEKARKILEDSMSHLKESLATQNLTLGKVELSVAQEPSRNGNDPSSGRQNPQQWQSLDLMNQNAGRQGQGSFSESWNTQGNPRGSEGLARATRPAPVTAPVSTGSGTGRLDVLA